MNEPLRVAHIITQLELGGAQQNTLYTLTHLNAERFAPILICGRGGLLDEEAVQSGVALHFVPRLIRAVNPIKDITAAFHLYKLLRQVKPHIVHTHSSKAGILGRIAAYLAGVPVIIHTFHGFGFTPAQSERQRRFYIRLEKLTASLSSRLIFVAQDNQEEARALGIGSDVPCALIRSGISLKNTSPTGATEIRGELGIPADAPLVLTVGNFKPQKNPMDAARVAVNALRVNPALHFVFVGDGELKPSVEAYVVAEGVEGHVHFVGWRRDTAALYHAATIYLLTSLWEGLPRSLLEASAAGLPSVAYAVNGVKDILVDEANGFLIPAGQVELAAEKILWLAGHPTEARAMGQHARQRIQKEFDIDEMVRRQEALYDECWDAVPLKDYFLTQWNAL